MKSTDQRMHTLIIVYSIYTKVHDLLNDKRIKINKNKIDKEKKKCHPQNKEYEENKWERKFDPVDNQQKMAIVQ
jgi:hypothetical protein